MFCVGWLGGVYLPGNGWATSNKEATYIRLLESAKLEEIARALPRCEAKKIYVKAISLADVPIEEPNFLKGRLLISLGKLGFEGRELINSKLLSSVQCLLEGISYFKLGDDLGNHEIISALISLGNSRYSGKLLIQGMERASKECLEYAGILSSKYKLTKLLAKVRVSYGNARDKGKYTHCYFNAIADLKKLGIETNSVLLAQAYLGHGNVLAEQKKWGEAYRYYNKVLEVLPSSLREEGLKVKMKALDQIKYIDTIEMKRSIRNDDEKQ